jgi:quinol monooxygenase YgiN
MAVTVVAIIKSKPGMESKVEQALRALIDPTRSEPGCINYDLHVQSDTPSVFMFHENWHSKEDLDGHLKMPYLEDFLSQAEELLSEPVSIGLYERIG